MSEALRRYPRIASNHSVLITKLDGEIEEFALTKTIAVGGCCVLSSERLGVGSPVELLIAIDRDNVIKARGNVVYEHVLDDGFSEVGVEFSNLDAHHAKAIERLFEPRDRAQLPLA